MAQITGLLSNGKPIITVALSEAVPHPTAVAPLAASLPFPLLEYRALLDTGADITCLCDRVVRENGLAPFGLINMTGGSGSNLHKSHLINLGVWCEDQADFEGQLEVQKTLYQLPDPLVAAAIRDNSWFDIIIGTDVIAHHELSFLKGGRFTFTLG